MTIPACLTALADLCDKHGTHAKGMGPELRLLAGAIRLTFEKGGKQ